MDAPAVDGVILPLGHHQLLRLAASLPVQAGERDGVTEAAEPELSVVPQYLDAEAHEVPECP